MKKNESLEFYVSELAKFKKANKTRRLYVANANGYKTVKGYRAALERMIAKLSPSHAEAETEVRTSEDNITIHNVHIIDRSGSMSGEKLRNALQGVNAEIADLQADDSVTYRQTVVVFDDAIDVLYSNSPIKSVGRIDTLARGLTALYQAAGETIERILNSKGDEKVLVKIFTDGDENASSGKYKYSEPLAELIEEVKSKGITVTFVGTQYDVNNIINRLRIDETNTLVHDNTSRGVADAFATTSHATKSYVGKVKRGEDVLKGFYKQTGKL